MKKAQKIKIGQVLASPPERGEFILEITNSQVGYQLPQRVQNGLLNRCFMKV